MYIFGEYFHLPEKCKLTFFDSLQKFVRKPLSGIELA